jgi:hypothetical protein
MDVIVQVAVLYSSVRPPYAGKYGISGEDLRAISEKKFKEFSFASGQGAFCMLAGHFPEGRVVGYIPEAQTLAVFPLPWPSENAADSCHELRKGKRLYDIIIRAAVQPGDAVVKLAQRRNQDNGGRDTQPPYCMKHSQPVHPGEHPIQENQVVGFLLYEMKPILTVAAHVCLKTLCFQLKSKRMAKLFIIFYYQNPQVNQSFLL